MQQALASAPTKEQAAFRAVAVLAGSTPTAPSVMPCDEVRPAPRLPTVGRQKPCWVVHGGVAFIADRRTAAIINLAGWRRVLLLRLARHNGSPSLRLACQVVSHVTSLRLMPQLSSS